MAQPYSSLTLLISKSRVVLAWRPEDQSQEMIIEAVDALLRNVQLTAQAAGINMECRGEIVSIEGVVLGEIGETEVLLWGGRQWEGKGEVKLALQEDGMVVFNRGKVAISEVKFYQSSPPPVPAPARITPDQLSKMKPPQQTCLALNGKVYDISRYHSSHPGGRVILSYAGKDATEAFSTFYLDQAHPWVNVASQPDVRFVGLLARK